MNVKTVLHDIVKQIDNDLYRNKNGRVVHKSEEFIDLYRNAHSTMLPDDYMYEHIYHLISEIDMYLQYKDDDCDDIDDLIDELMGEINIDLDQDTVTLLTWMGSDLNRYAIVNELYKQDYKYGSFFDLMQVAQSIEIEEVKMSILNDLRSMLKKIEDNQSS